MKKVAVLTALNKYYGSGHYEKSKILLKLVQEKAMECTLYVLSQYPYKKTEKERHLKNIWQLASEFEKNPFDLLLIDKRQTPKDFIIFFRQKGVRVVILDSITEEQAYADYVINAIPHTKSVALANLSDLSYLPPIEISPKRGKFQISIFCGFIDSKELMLLWLRNFDFILSSLNIHKVEHVNIFVGEGSSLGYYDKVKKLALQKLKETPYTIYWKSPLFKETVANSSLFLTYYGMSALEAASLGTPILLCNPSPYHEELSLNFFPNQTLKKEASSQDLYLAGCCDIGTRTLKNRSIETLATNKILTYEELLKHTEKTRQYLREEKHIGDNFHKIPDILLGLMQFPMHLECKNCGSKSIFIIHRLINENFYQCPVCALIYKERVLTNGLIHEEKNIEYNESYFLEEYEKSYKKTYEEDKEHLYKMAEERLKIIKHYKKGSKKTLLDIGCALGYFLDIAKSKYRFLTYGVEVSSYAAEKVDPQHMVFNGSIFDFEGIKRESEDKPERFDVISLWYVIEHFNDHHEIFSKIASLQKKGGILAMSTPNVFGLSGRFNTEEFLSSSPQDHYYLYGAPSLINLLSLYGYKHLKTKSTGIHYERFKKIFPRLSKWIGPKIYHFIASHFNLGDTFEIYFKKSKIGVD